MKIFIGHDTKYPQATDVCYKSIRDNGFDGDINCLIKKSLIAHEIYGREDVKGESTEFSFTRFYVPLLCGYKGIAMFCDNDFLWKCNPLELLDYLGDNDVAVVKHPTYEATGNKMDGIKNKTYPRKNWSSLMIFNCNKLQHLDKSYLDKASPSLLHELRWAYSIGEIPMEYNCLVGHYKCDNAKALHYTNGGPWFDKYKNSELSEEWWKVYNSL